MKDWLLNLYIRLKMIPLILRLITVFCLGGILPVVIAIVPLPYGSYAINNVPIGYVQLWKSGYGLFSVLLGLFLLMIARGLILRKAWTRFVILFLWPAEIIIAGIRGLPAADMLKAFSYELIVLLPLTWYLFYKRTVKEYFLL